MNDDNKNTVNYNYKNSHIKHGVAYWLVLALVVFVVVTIVNNKQDNKNPNTITVNGTGIAYAIQDTLEISFTVTRTAQQVADAQNKMNVDVATILDAVKALGAQDKDIKTTAYNVSPHYVQMTPTVCPAGTYCPVQSKIDGYDASETIEVKLHDLSKASDLVTAIGKGNPTYVSGLQFVVENDDAVKAEARNNAIDDAKTKAKDLAKALGVHLGKVVSFNESSGSGPIPFYTKAAGIGGAPEIAASIPTGQNEVDSNVTIVYEIN